ncbi:hypothetical protein EHS13_27200 [Paenibacillus psychroresistens]|uniref:DUF4432 family protein n=1 Tax=Paenibacillus psychroresistens TaxID=1778678 RepID=A0A6B8RQP0_9BACL|nr:aldose 1-epimerase family protein [Paenibacillus psychroresistens]QGQ98309.1 hypothetical protein EHS13_27200 [Paenibacillus psychroresistens]
MSHLHNDRNYGCRIKTELVYKGYSMVVLENEHFRLSILPGKGTDIIELLHKKTDTDFNWFTYLGLRKKEAAFTSFQMQYEGGWQEILPNLSGEHLHNGVKLEAYGEVSLSEWSYSIVKDDPEEIAVKFENNLRSMPLRIEKLISMRNDQAGFDIQETLYNTSTAIIMLDWGHHITFGSPFLQPGTRIELPDSRDAYRVPEPKSPGGFEVFPCDIGSYRLINPQGIGAEIKWDAGVWPYLWFWRDYGESTAAPYYGKHFNVGLEVFSSPPASLLQDNVIKGTAICLPPMGEKHASINFSVIN